ncbi:MAG TPA: hypothetical protein VF765_05180 [Polyangiaceae bacterium]
MMQQIQLAAALSALSAAASVALAANAAHAAVGQPEEHHAVVGNVEPGPTIEAHGAYSFDPTYGMGFGGRLGYTLRQGIYLGGAVNHFVGAAGAPEQTLLGGDVGLKIFPTENLEIRPYGFAGDAISSAGNKGLAVAPGGLVAYHFGPLFVDADARYMVTPAPKVFLLMGGAGLGF